MSENSNKSEHDARKAIRILDKMIAKDESIIAAVEKAKKRAVKLSSENKREIRTVQLIIMHYSNLCALGGGVSGIPGMIPGVGSVLSIFGAGALDAMIALKYEIEMILALSYFAGIDISDPKERKIAYLLACASLEEAYETEREPNLKGIIDLAVSEYSTRELSKTLIKALARVIVMFGAKRWVRFFPVVGMAIGASVNKVLSLHMGYEAWRVIKKRNR